MTTLTPPMLQEAVAAAPQLPHAHGAVRSCASDEEENSVIIDLTTPTGPAGSPSGCSASSSSSLSSPATTPPRTQGTSEDDDSASRCKRSERGYGLGVVLSLPSSHDESDLPTESDESGTGAQLVHLSSEVEGGLDLLAAPPGLEPPSASQGGGDYRVLQLECAQHQQQQKVFRPLLPSVLVVEHLAGNMDPSSPTTYDLLSSNPSPATASSSSSSTPSTPSSSSSSASPPMTMTVTMKTATAGGTSSIVAIARFKPSPRDVISGIAPHVFDERRRRRSRSPSGRRGSGSTGRWYYRQAYGLGRPKASPLRRSVVVSWDEKKVYLEEATPSGAITSRISIDIATGQERTVLSDPCSPSSSSSSSTSSMSSGESQSGDSTATKSKRMRKGSLLWIGKSCSSSSAAAAKQAFPSSEQGQPQPPSQQPPQQHKGGWGGLRMRLDSGKLLKTLGLRLHSSKKNVGTGVGEVPTAVPTAVAV